MGLRAGVLCIFVSFCVTAFSQEDETVRLRSSLECVLEAVSSLLGIELSEEIAPPALELESQISEERFAQYQEAEARQSGQRPLKMTNFYSDSLNTIFLSDRRQNYRGVYTLDDSLAHELTHFLQYKYIGMDRLGDDRESEPETMAATVQSWFYNRYTKTGETPCPSL